MSRAPLLSSPRAFIKAITLLGVIFTCAFLLALSQAYAQSSDDVTDSDIEQESPISDNEAATDPAEDKSTPQTSKTSEPSGVFIPSEELSEDSSAPFPVDI